MNSYMNKVLAGQLSASPAKKEGSGDVQVLMRLHR